MVMECGGGTWVGFYTDTCLRPNCGNVTSGLAMIIIDDRDDNDLMMPHQLKTVVSLSLEGKGVSK